MYCRVLCLIMVFIYLDALRFCVFKVWPSCPRHVNKWDGSPIVTEPLTSRSHNSGYCHPWDNDLMIAAWWDLGLRYWGRRRLALFREQCASTRHRQRNCPGCDQLPAPDEGLLSVLWHGPVIALRQGPDDSSLVRFGPPVLGLAPTCSF